MGTLGNFSYMISETFTLPLTKDKAYGIETMLLISSIQQSELLILVFSQLMSLIACKLLDSTIKFGQEMEEANRGPPLLLKFPTEEAQSQSLKNWQPHQDPL